MKNRGIDLLSSVGYWRDAFLWVTTRERLVGLGYGWTTRTVYIAIAASSLIIGLNLNSLWIREISTAFFLVAALISMAVSIKKMRGHRPNDYSTEQVPTSQKCSSGINQYLSLEEP